MARPDFDKALASSANPTASMLDLIPGRGEYIGDGIPRTAGGRPYDPMEGLPPLPGRHAAMVKADEVQVCRPRFIDDPMIPLGVLTMIAGRAGVSKSTLSIDRAAKATRGLLDGDLRHKPVTVAFSGLEDSLSMQKARLMAAGADMSRVLFLTMQDTLDGVRP